MWTFVGSNISAFGDKIYVQEVCGAIVSANMKPASDPCSVKYFPLPDEMVKPLGVSQ